MDVYIDGGKIVQQYTNAAAAVFPKKAYITLSFNLKTPSPLPKDLMDHPGAVPVSASKVVDVSFSTSRLAPPIMEVKDGSAYFIADPNDMEYASQLSDYAGFGWLLIRAISYSTTYKDVAMVNGVEVQVDPEFEVPGLILNNNGSQLFEVDLFPAIGLSVNFEFPNRLVAGASNNETMESGTVNGAPGLKLTPEAKYGNLTFDPASDSTDSDGRVVFEAATDLGSFGGAGSLADQVRVRGANVTSPWQSVTIYFATVVAPDGSVTMGGSPLTSGAHLKAGDVVALGNGASVDIAFANGAVGGYSNNFSEQPVNITISASGPNAAAQALARLPSGQQIMTFVMKKSVSFAVKQTFGFGFVGGQGISYAVNKMYDWSVGSNSLRTGAETSAPRESTPNDSLTAYLMDDGSLRVENRGAPMEVTGPGGSVILPQGTGVTGSATGVFSPVSSISRALGLGIPVSLASVPITITPGQGSVLQTQTPLVSFEYPHENNNPISEFSTRLNGVLVSPYMSTGAISTTWKIPPALQLEEGTNTIEASLLTGVGNRRTSASVQVTAGANPTVPTGLVANSGKQSVILRWNANVEPDLAGYRVYRASSAGGAPQAISTYTVTHPIFVDTTPITPTAGYYSVSAVDRTGNSSGATQPISATLASALPVLTPAAVSGLSAAAGDRSVSVAASYTDTNTLAWKLTRAEAAGGPFSDVPTTGQLLAGPRFVDESVMNGRSYWYRLTPLGYDLREGTPAVTGPVTPTDLAPASPGGLTAFVDQDVLSLRWNPSKEQDLAGYNVWRAAPGNSFTKQNAVLLAGPTYTETLSLDSLYAWRVSAVDAAGNESQRSPSIMADGRRSDRKQFLLVTQSITGTISASPTGQEHQNGASVTLTAVPLQGYAFIRWSGDLQGSDNPKTITLTADTSVSAVFEELAFPGAVPVITFAGSGAAAYLDGTGESAAFSSPGGVSVDSSGNVYVADYRNNRIRKISSAGVVTTLAGSGEAGSQDGQGASASFNLPLGVAADGSGNVYVADQDNSLIRKITPTGTVSTLAGSGFRGHNDGAGPEAMFYYPSAVALDASGNVYVADSLNNAIRKVTPAGVVTTLAGSSRGNLDGTGSQAQFSEPRGVAVDRTGQNVYVADSGNHSIRRVTADGVVTTIAGSGTAGDQDGTGSLSSFNSPRGLAVDGSGNIYVADNENHRVRKVTPAGTVTTIAGAAPGFRDGAKALLNNPLGVAVNGSGMLYVGDYGNNRIRAMSIAPNIYFRMYLPVTTRSSAGW